MTWISSVILFLKLFFSRPSFIYILTILLHIYYITDVGQDPERSMRVHETKLDRVENFTKVEEARGVEGVCECTKTYVLADSVHKNRLERYRPTPLCLSNLNSKAAILLLCSESSGDLCFTVTVLRTEKEARG